MNEFFPLTERGFHRIRRTYVVRIAIALALSGVFVLSYVTNPIDDIAVLVAPNLIVLAFVLYVVRQAIRLRSSGIVLNDAWIAESHDGRASGRTIGLADISRIESTETGALLVFGTRGVAPLLVDQDLENIEVIRAHLATRCPIVPRPRLSLMQRRPLPFLILWLIVVMFCMALRDRALAVGGAVLSCGLLACWLFASRRLFGVEIGRGYRIAGIWLIIFFGFMAAFRFMQH
jgi:hypothetical protein